MDLTRNHCTKEIYAVSSIAQNHFDENNLIDCVRKFFPDIMPVGFLPDVMADITFSRSLGILMDSLMGSLSILKHIVSLIIKCYSKTKGRIPTGIVVCVLNFGRRILL